MQMSGNCHIMKKNEMEITGAIMKKQLTFCFLFCLSVCLLGCGKPETPTVLTSENGSNEESAQKSFSVESSKIPSEEQDDLKNFGGDENMDELKAFLCADDFYVPFLDKYRLYCPNTASINEGKASFAQYMVTTDEENPKVICATIGGEYSKDVLFQECGDMSDEEKSKLMSDYISKRQELIDAGFSEKPVWEILKELFDSEGACINAGTDRTEALDILLQYMLVPQTTTLGAEFVMPVGFGANSTFFAFHDINSDGADDLLLGNIYEGMDTVERVGICVPKEKWNDSMVIDGILYIDAKTGLLYDSTNEFCQKYYRFDGTKITEVPEFSYTLEYTDSDGETMYKRTDPDGTQKIIALEEGISLEHGVVSVSEIPIKWMPLSPLHAVFVCLGII